MKSIEEKKEKRFHGVVQYTTTATAKQRPEIANKMVEAINESGYTLTDENVSGKLVQLKFITSKDTSLSAVNILWSNAWAHLSPALKQVSHNE